jgi:hypothetical protein
MKRTAKTAILSTLFALAFAAPASAHHVNASTSSADCTKVIAQYESFSDGDKPVSEKITVDGTVVYNKGGYTWSGANSAHTISYPSALATGDHTVVFTASWQTQGQNNNTFTKSVSCGNPPASSSHVNASASSADCTTLTVKYESFSDGDKPISEKITLDGTVVYNKGGYTWSGANNAHTFNYPPGLSPGDHTVVFTASWQTQSDNANGFTVRVHCESPPPPPAPSYGCDGKMVDRNHPAAKCPGPAVSVSIPAPAPKPAPVKTVCVPRGTLVLYTRHSKILAERVYVNGRIVASSHPNANSHRDRFALSAETGPTYTMRIIARLRSDRTGRVFRWAKTVKVQRCGVAPARARHIDP